MKKRLTRSLGCLAQTILCIVFSISSAMGQATFCSYYCDNPVSDGCLSCDIEGELPGYYPSETITLPPPPSSASPICGTLSVDNTIWYVFIAGSIEIEIELFYDECSGFDGGLYMGLMDGCGGPCIATDGGCMTGSASIAVANLIVGNTYAFWIDGCVGSVCGFDIEVTGQVPFELDEPYSISAYSECKGICLTEDLCEEVFEADCMLTDGMVVCPGEEVTFRPRHQGNSITDYGDYDAACSFYPPELDAEFIWYFDGEELVSGAEGLTLVIPDVDYILELCLLSVSNSCAETFSEACIVIYVEPAEPETFTYNVCGEDISDEWEVPLGEDPNGDGYGWQGPEEMDLTEVINWDEGCQMFFFEDEDCECLIVQTLCIITQGESEPDEVTELYMYGCQFDEDGEYEWIWEEDDYVLTRDVSNEYITIPEGSLLEDWDEELCDTSLLITVKTYDIQGNLSRLDCSEQDGGWAEYQFDLDLRFLENEVYEDWPEIDEDYKVDWIICDTGQELVGTSPRTFLAEVEDYNLCIRVSYEFSDGAWGDPLESPLARRTSCDKIFGPYQLLAGCEDSGSCPNFEDGIQVEINGVPAECTSSPCVVQDNDFINIRITEQTLPSGWMNWRISTDPSFDPTSEGTSLGSLFVESNWRPETQSPELLAINYRDPIYNSEYIIVGTGSGFRLGNLSITADCDTLCNPNCEEDRTISSWTTTMENFIFDCPNVIAVGADDILPPNSILIAFIDGYENQFLRSAEKFCKADGCVYVTVAQEPRCYDAFADEGMASYTISDGFQSSTLEYVARAEGGSVNSRGEYSSAADSFPDIDQLIIPITATVSDLQLELSCAEYSGIQYVKGVIQSEVFNYDCCNAVTPTFAFNIECDDPETEIFWLEPLFLPGDLTVDMGDCGSSYVFPNGVFDNEPFFPPNDGGVFASTCQGPATFSSTHTPSSEFPEGVTTVTYTIRDLCGNSLSHSFTVTVRCDTMPPEDNVFEDFPWLTTLVDPDDCEGVTITVYAQGVYNFIHVETATSGTLYFQDGTLYCTDSASFSCVTAYGFGAPVDTWTCEDGGGNPPGPGGDPEVFTDFPFLTTLVDVDDCEGTTVSVYAQGVYNFIHIQTADSGILYFQDGTLYCTDSPGFSCVTAYGFGAPTSVWECGDGGGVDPPVGPNFLPDFPWLEDVVDLSDCSGTSVFVYASGVYSYIFVEENGLMTMYNGAGQFYCQDAPGFSCLSAYGFTSSDLTDEWTCVQLVGEIPTESREEIVQELMVNVYPNPSNGIFNLDVNVEEYSLEVFDLNGKVIEFETGQKDLHAGFNLRRQPSGVYLLMIRSGDTVQVKRIMKL